MIQFPKDFLWGTATSSYQIEGAHNEDGKGPSIWDAFCTIPNRIKNFDNGDVAIDHYHRYKEDVALIKKQGFKAYRFSIAWPRVMPEGKGAINEKGIAFYSNLIDELLANDIEPWITLYHWDLPLALQNEEDGWLNRKMVEYFTEYAELCFSRFGDRVKNWITLNEPWVVSILGYGEGVFAPGRKSHSEPYLAAHHLLLAHANAVKLYRTKFSHQKGQIGITNNCDWREPASDEPADIEAAERALEFFLAWFTDPIYKGDYPEVMRERVGDRLPSFSEEEKSLLTGSTDFFGLNHYTTLYVKDTGDEIVTGKALMNGGVAEDQHIELFQDKEWKLTAMKWAVVPWGFRKLLEWIDARYDGPVIYITENGCAYEDEVIDGQVNDEKRIEYYEGYLGECQKAMDNGVKVKGYFAWSLFDNFEWSTGYFARFGINFVDYRTLERIPKASSRWFSELFKSNS